MIAQALKQSQLPAEALSYIEAHGTGTSLGDPIEIAGLTKAFNQSSAAPLIQSCAIGSAKSNIGHRESAAGIAGLTKVLLQLEHQPLVPSLHSQTLNPHIDFANTPFWVQQTLTRWERPRRMHEGVEREYSRIAGISSFGAGGSNAHVIIAEHEPAAREPIEVNEQRPALIVLSAKSEVQLQQRAQQLLTALESERYSDTALADIAYTLQVGREAMEQRLAFTAASLSELRQMLQRYVDADASGVNELYRGEVKRHKEALSLFTADEDLQQAISAWVAKGKYAKLLELWVKGLTVDWSQLYEAARRPRRISLPVYPFAKERHWMPEVPRLSAAGAQMLASHALHPLLHQNTSSAFEVKFGASFTGTEFFLADHQVQGQKILPGVAHLEMARAALAQALDSDSAVELSEVVWLRALVHTPATPSVQISVVADSETQAQYEIHGTDAQVYSRGTGRLIVAEPAPESVALDQLRQICTREPLTRAQLYEQFAQLGLQYGAGHQSLTAVHVGMDDYQRPQVLARLELPEALVATASQYVLHPSVMDGALQAVIGLAWTQAHAAVRLPFALERVRIHGPSPQHGYAWVRYSEGSAPGETIQRVDISVCDEQGRVSAQLQGLTSRPIKEAADATATRSLDSADEQTLLLQPQWQERPIVRGGPSATAGDLFMIGEFDTAQRARIEQQLMERGLSANVQWAELRGLSLADRYEQLATQLLILVQQRLREKLARQHRVQVVIALRDDMLAQCCAGLSALLRTASRENPRLLTQCLQIEMSDADALSESRLVSIIEAQAQDTASAQVRYRQGRREVKTLVEMSDRPSAGIPWRDNGVYLITGGAGGLGLIFAKEIAQQVQTPTLILTGSRARSDDDPHIEALKATGARVEYRVSDVSNAQAVAVLVNELMDRYGTLNGVIHSAGVIKDDFLINKTAAELKSVLAPKVGGLLNLDQATADLPLDLLVTFSSIASAFGSVGQADYASANAWMDCYASWRNEQVAQGRRFGRTLSIAWPLWAEGGMQVSEAIQEQMKQRGLYPLPSSAGIAAFYHACQCDQAEVAVVQGTRRALLDLIQPDTASEPETIAAAVGGSRDVVTASRNEAPVAEPQDLKQQTAQYLTKQLAATLKLSAERIEADAPLEKYGIDSILALRMVETLEQVLGPLSKTLLFEYQSIEALAQYCLEHHREQVMKLLGRSAVTQADSNAAPPALVTHRARVRPRVHAAWQQAPLSSETDGAQDIAIIGVSGRYPQANDLRAYWENLKSGKDCITEIPASRWDYRQYFDAQHRGVGKSYSKWGGFIDGVDEFDPLFFNISPKEAQWIDPQERLFLQCVYETLEDAGHTRESLGVHRERSVGVFVGVMYEEYQLYGAQAQALGQPFAVGGNPGSIANRVSYFCNFHGPSLAVDTMCSSSLTAIHLACESLRNGSCEVAVAGGVNVSIHPNKYLLLSQGQFASSVGRCESFGKGGDGYVPGEGVGAVLLKPLRQALAAGDHVYAVIKGSSVNHGGKTNGYTVPNPQAQAQVIAQALKQSQLPAEALSYIEAHGTGTSLGDPIEIAGLTKAFNQSSAAPLIQSCAIGSAKSNIGHCESAAGIAGLTKVLLQLEHQQLVPSLHSQTLNPHIDFANTPFWVQQTLTRWERPRRMHEGVEREYSRIAGISSFGAGGSNAHVIIAEHEPAAREPIEVNEQRPALIVLSAKSEAQLQQRAQQLLTALESERYSDTDLADIAYTLQVGREAMEQRLAFTAASLSELRQMLQRYVDADASGVNQLYRGEVKRHKEALSLFTADEDLQQAISAWVAKGKYAKLLELWVKGLTVDWSQLYEAARRPRRISLPVYPFAKERHWMPEVPRLSAAGAQMLASHALHPLLHRTAPAPLK